MKIIDERLNKRPVRLSQIGVGETFMWDNALWMVVHAAGLVLSGEEAGEIKCCTLESGSLVLIDGDHEVIPVNASVVLK